MKRAPIVTILGHVDHGKTTLLDKFRSSNVVRGEAGGITQSIGASQVKTKTGAITFIDTPGHAAFNKMRATGAQIADIAVLVVAADDGPMPQTKEALQYIKKADLPLIVAITKIDLKTANPERAIGELEKLEILFEGRGGSTPFVKVSATTGEGVDDLLEMIELVAEVSELEGDSEGQIDAAVFETKLDKGGPLVSVAIKNGSIKVGQTVSAGVHTAKIKNLFNADAKPAKVANPGDAVQILGFTELPEIGDKLAIGESDKKQKNEKRKIPTIEEGEVALIVKAQTAGSLEALVNSLPEKAVIMDKSVGDVTDKDVFFAKTSGARIYTFESKVGGSVKRLAENEGVEVESFRIIYELIQKVEKLIKDKEVVVTGMAEILAKFPFNKQVVAGCKIKSGSIKKTDKPQLVRNEKVLGTVKILSLKKAKAEVDEVGTGEECGILFAPQLDFELGDMLISSPKTEGKNEKS